MPVSKTTKEALIEQEAEWYLPAETNPYGITLTMTNNLLIPTAGIDESNGNSHYILWPKNPEETAKSLLVHLLGTRQVRHLGVLITDSRTTPMRCGTSGVCLSYAGFIGVNDYIGKPDLFGYTMRVTKTNIADGLAAAAVVTMGETNEQTPLALISDVPFVHFDEHAPTKEELASWKISKEEDLYGPLLQSPLWKKGKANTS